MPEIRCPCCGEMIEVTYLEGGKVTCLGEGKETVLTSKEGEFFDKTLHPPTLTRHAHETERERFKKALGELPNGSAGTEIEEGADLPVEEEPTYERDAQGKPKTDISKLISEEEEED